MKIEKTIFQGVLILTPKIFEDERGSFSESYSQKTFLENGLDYNFIQDNNSFNKNKYTFRGLHFQLNPKSQTTLIRVTNGEIMDFIVDIRQKSPTFGKYISQILSGINHKQILIPKGFAHGFLTLSDNVNIIYKMDEIYAPKYDRILNFQDKSINLKIDIDLKNITIANKDKNAPMLKDIDNNFFYEDKN